MQYNPHDYQKYAIDFIETHPQAAVLLGCGLGKTSITLTALNDLMFDRFEVRKPLIIAPIRVCRNSWAAEIAKWDHLNGMTYSLILGTKEQRLAALRQKADLYIINRENVQWLVESSGMPFDFDMVVLFHPSGLQGLLSSFKNFEQGDLRIATFGNTAAQAIRNAELRLDLAAPNPKAPSMASAIDLYLQEQNSAAEVAPAAKKRPKKRVAKKAKAEVPQRSLKDMSAEEIYKMRSEAAKRAAATRKAKAEAARKRSEAAKKGAATKRAKAEATKRATQQ